MSQITAQIDPILPTVKQNWTDLNKDGRRMEKVIKKCITEFSRKENTVDIRLAFLDRAIKATTTKQSLAITVLGVKKSLEDAKKR